MRKTNLTKLGESLRLGKVSSFELTRDCLRKIEYSDHEIGAFLSVFKEDALAAAKAFDALPEGAKWKSPLSGIPMAIKDNLMVAGKRTTCASKMLADFVSPYDATVVSRLKDIGAIIVGKTNMDEFGMGSTTEHSAFHITRNPLDRSRVPGGSSGGSAAAVAADMVPYALGSDTGGSLRLPASYCGLVGMRPTYGTVSRFGLTAFCSSMDTVGPLTKTVKDSALVYGAIVGKDMRDATSKGFDFSVPETVSRLRIGVISELLTDCIGTAAKQALELAICRFEAIGARVEYASIPETIGALSAYYVISSAEASSNLARFDGVRYGYRAQNRRDVTELYQTSREEGFGGEVKRRIRLGTYALTKENKDAYYERGLLFKKNLCAAFERAFETYDILLCPTAPDIAPKIGQLLTPEEMYMTDLCTVPMSLAGLPSLSLPVCEDGGLPVGVQLVGRAFTEGLLYYAGMLYEGSLENGTV